MKLALNFLLFQVGWFASVIGAARGMPWAGPLVVAIVVLVHLKLAERPQAEGRLILAAVVAGLLADSLLVSTGWVRYPNGQWLAGMAPYWIISMWALFATTLNVSMRWLRPSLVVAALAGAIGGPLSFIAGAKLGAIEFLQPQWALAALAVIWAIALPFLSRLGERLEQGSDRMDRSAGSTTGEAYNA